jgi:hypothetical protein
MKKTKKEGKNEKKARNLGLCGRNHVRHVYFFIHLRIRERKLEMRSEELGIGSELHLSLL